MLSSPLAILFVTVVLDLIGFGMVVPLMPLYAQQFSASPIAISALLAAYSLMQLVFAPLWGQLSDRIGRRPVLLGSMVGNVLALLAFASAQSFVQLLAARLIAGVCTANISVASAYVADSTAPEGRARGMGLIGAAFGLGFVLGPALAGELAVFGTRAAPLVAAALATVNVAMAWARLPESLPPARRAQARAGHNVFAARLEAVGAVPQALGPLALVAAQIGGFAMMEMALALMLRERLGLDARASGRTLAYLGLVLAGVQGGLIGPLTRWLGSATLVRAGLACMAIGLLAVPLAVPSGLLGVLVALGVVAAGQGLVGPSLSAVLSQAAPPTRQGAVLGLSQSSSALARVLGPAAAGALMARYGTLMPFVGGSALLAAAALGACWAVPSRVGDALGGPGPWQRVRP